MDHLCRTAATVGSRGTIFVPWACNLRISPRHKNRAMATCRRLLIADGSKLNGRGTLRYGIVSGWLRSL